MLIVEVASDWSQRGVMLRGLPSGSWAGTLSWPPSPDSATASVNGPCALPHQLLHTKNTNAVPPGRNTTAPLLSGVVVGVPSPTASPLYGRLATGIRLPLASV